MEELIIAVLRTPIASDVNDSGFGFEALNPDGSTRLGLSEQVFAAQARVALTRNVPGAIFNEITAHRDENGQLMKIKVDYMDQIHDPSPRSMVVDFRN